MRTKVTITLDSGEVITELYAINNTIWPWQKRAIEMFILRYINIEREEAKQKNANK